MAVIVSTNSYGDETGLASYALERGVTITGDSSALLIKAMDYIEAQQYFGERYDYDQALSFPRSITKLYDDYGEVPVNVIKAQYVAALLIDSGEDLNPTVTPSLKRVKVDVIEEEYKDNGNNVNYYPQVDMLLSPYLNSTGVSFRVSR